MSSPMISRTKFFLLKVEGHEPQQLASRDMQLGKIFDVRVPCLVQISFMTIVKREPRPNVRETECVY